MSPNSFISIGNIQYATAGGSDLRASTEWLASRLNDPSELPAAAELTRLFERGGVSDATRVVLYGDNLVLAAARAWFTLGYMGTPQWHLQNSATLVNGREKR